MKLRRLALRHRWFGWLNSELNLDRLLVVFCHNTDLGDGWEHEGDDAYFSKEFSPKKAYPMGINIVLYALSHE